MCNPSAHVCRAPEADMGSRVCSRPFLVWLNLVLHIRRRFGFRCGSTFEGRRGVDFDGPVQGNLHAIDRQACLFDGPYGTHDIISREAQSLATFLPVFLTVLAGGHSFSFLLGLIGALEVSL
jgi:hypothetical protein